MVNGKTGLVPGNYLIPVRDSSWFEQYKHIHRLQDSGFHDSISPSSLSATTDTPSMDEKTVTTDSKVETNPEPASNLKIERVVGDRNKGNRSLLISWSPPGNLDAVVEYKVCTTSIITTN